MVEKGVVGSHEQPSTPGQTGGSEDRTGASHTVLTIAAGSATVSTDPTAVLQTATIGSGVAVALFDPESKVGGILHFCLPDSSIDETRRIRRPSLFADSGLELLLHNMKTHGAAQPALLACHLVGGADPMHLGITEPILSLGERNSTAVRELAEKVGLTVTEMRIGGHSARRAELEISTGVVRVTETPAERRFS